MTGCHPHPYRLPRHPEWSWFSARVSKAFGYRSAHLARGEEPWQYVEPRPRLYTNLVALGVR